MEHRSSTAPGIRGHLRFRTARHETANSLKRKFPQVDGLRSHRGRRHCQRIEGHRPSPPRPRPSRNARRATRRTWGCSSRTPPRRAGGRPPRERSRQCRRGRGRACARGRASRVRAGGAAPVDAVVATTPPGLPEIHDRESLPEGPGISSSAPRRRRKPTPPPRRRGNASPFGNASPRFRLRPDTAAAPSPRGSSPRRCTECRRARDPCASTGRARDSGSTAATGRAAG